MSTTEGSRKASALLAVVSTLLGALLVVLTTTAPAEATPTSCSSLQVLAHRGYHYGSIPENTLKAFDEAALRGYTIETDVRADAEGVLWIFHDRDVFRTTGQHAFIDQLTTAQVSALRYKKGNFTYPLPRLSEAIATWQSYDPSIKIYLEPKSASIANGTAQAVEAAGLTSRVVYTAAQTYLHTNFPSSLLMARSATSVPDPQTFVNGGYSDVMFGPTQLTSGDADAYHAKGLRLQLRTANLTNDWRTAIRTGFDGILTDLPNELVSFCPVALEPPTVTSFTPSSGGPGTAVTITGTYFTDATTVRFGNVTTPFTIVSSTQITTTVPANVSGNVPITVTTPNGDGVSSSNFQVPLTIDSFSPTSGPRGSTVVITGQGFTGTDRVRFGTVDAVYTVDSNTQITATVPAGATASSKIYVRTPSGSVSSEASFKIPPVVTSFTPTSGPAGTVVTITGSAFAGATAVKFGTVSAASFTVDSDTQITVTVPAGVQGGSTVQVVSPGGTGTSSGTYGQPAPSVTSFTPATAIVGSAVTITGANFTGATSVLFGSVAAASFTVDSDTQVTAVVPSNAPASGKLTVTTPNGSGVSSTSFTVSAPTITSFTPASAGVTATVTITGTSFTGATAVKFGSSVAAASFTVDSDTQITATVPTDVPASSTIRVTTPGGTATSSSSFTLAKPVISGFTPTSGPIGSTVVITGTYLTGATSVKFGTTVATSYTVDSDTQISVVVPAGAVRSKVWVGTRAGNVQSVDFFTVTP